MSVVTIKGLFYYYTFGSSLLISFNINISTIADTTVDTKKCTQSTSDRSPSIANISKANTFIANVPAENTARVVLNNPFMFFLF